MDTNYSSLGQPYFTFTPDQLKEQTWFDSERYPFPPHFAKTSFGKMHYVDEGAGIPVVLLHGTPSWSFEYAGVIPELVKAGFRVIAPDWLGFGLSERPGGRAVEKQLASSEGWHAENESSYYSPAFHRAALAELLVQLRLPAIHLVVHDMSGPIVWPLIREPARASANPQASGHSDFPQILSASLINTWAWSFFGSVPKFEKTAKMLGGGVIRWLYLSAGFSTKVLLPKAWGVPVDKSTVQHLSKMMPNRPSRPATYAVVRSLIQPDGAPQAGTIQAGPDKVAAQLIWGMKDTLLPEEFISIWQKCPALQAVHRINDSGHFPHITHYGQVADQIGRFIHNVSSNVGHAPKVTGKGSENR